jgi:hypothetical protein
MASETKQEGTAKTQKPATLLGRPRARGAKAPTVVVTVPPETDTETRAPEAPAAAVAAKTTETQQIPAAGAPSEKGAEGDSTAHSGEAIANEHAEVVPHAEPGDFTVACKFCRRNQEVCRSRLRNAFEWSISFLILPYRCLYCGYRGFALRFQVPKSPANQEILREINPKR